MVLSEQIVAVIAAIFLFEFILPIQTVFMFWIGSRERLRDTKAIFSYYRDHKWRKIAFWLLSSIAFVVSSMKQSWFLYLISILFICYAVFVYRQMSSFLEARFKLD